MVTHVCLGRSIEAGIDEYKVQWQVVSKLLNYIELDPERHDIERVSH